MSFYTGTNGFVEIRKGVGNDADQGNKDNEENQGRVRNWQYTTTMSQLDATTLADTDRVPVNGIRSTKGSCQILYYKDGVKESSLYQWLRKFSKTRNNTDYDADYPGQASEASQMWLHLFVKTADNTEAGVKMQINITSISMACSVGDIVSANVQFESVGAVLEMTLGK